MDAESSSEQKTWQVYSLGKRNVWKSRSNESRQSSVALALGPAHCGHRCRSIVRQEIFLPQSTFSADSLMAFVHVKKSQALTVKSLCRHRKTHHILGQPSEMECCSQRWQGNWPSGGSFLRGIFPYGGLSLGESFLWRIFGKIQGDGREFPDCFKSYFGSQLSSQSLTHLAPDRPLFFLTAKPQTTR